MRRADLSSRGAVPSVACLIVVVNLRQLGGPGPLEALVPGIWGRGIVYALGTYNLRFRKRYFL